MRGFLAAIATALLCLAQPAFAAPEPPLEDPNTDTLFVRGARFDLQRYNDPTNVETPSKLQLVHRGRVFLEAVSYFQVIARAGSTETEMAIVQAHGSRLHSDKSVHRWHTTAAIVARRGGDPELWTLEISPSRDDDGLGVWTAGDALVVGDRLRPNGTRNRFQWSARDGWQQIERASPATFDLRPTEILAQLPAGVSPEIADFCATAQSALARAACGDPGFTQAEISLRQALERAVEILEPSARPRFVYEHNAWSARRDAPCSDDDRGLPWEGPHHCVTSRTTDRSALYALLADKSFEDEQGIVTVGTTQLRWVYFSGGSADQHITGIGAHVLLLGRSIVAYDPMTYGYDAGHVVEIDGSHLMLVASRGSGPRDCPTAYLIEERPNKDLRSWTVSCGYGLEKNDKGVVLVRAASPSLDGVVYRWTPTAGLKFDHALQYEAAPDTNLESMLERRRRETLDPPPAAAPLEPKDFFDGLRRAAGPSYRRFAEIFEMGAVITSALDDRYLVFKECDFHRFCHFNEAIRVIYDHRTEQFYIAAHRPGFGACLQAWGALGVRNPGIENASHFPIEYHPAAEAWPAEVHEALWKSLCG